MLKPNPFSLGVTVALVVGLMSACGGGGNDAPIPDPANQGGRVEEPQVPIRNAAVLSGIRKLQPIPAALKNELPGFNAVLQLLMHNPAWAKKAMNPEISSRYALLEEYKGLSDLIIAFQQGLGLEKSHARLVKAYSSESENDEKRGALLSDLNLAPVSIDEMEARLGQGQTIFVISEDEKSVQINKLPAQQRIIGVALFDGKDHMAYLKKGDKWFGTNEEKFTQVDANFIKRLGQDGKEIISTVAYSAA